MKTQDGAAGGRPAGRWTVERLNDAACLWRSCILLTAAHLKLFEFLARRGASTAEVAAHYGGALTGWEVFFKALCAMGILRRRGRLFYNTAFAARHLDRCGARRLAIAYDELGRWSELAAALTMGKRPRRQIPFATNLDQAQELLESLDLDARAIAPHVQARLRLTNAKRLLDIGGGLGAYAISFCRQYRGLSATIVEHPKIAPLTRRAILRARMDGRIDVREIDIVHGSLPKGYDAVLLFNMLHAHGADENKTLLAKLHRSLKRQGQLILRDIFMGEDGTVPEWGALFSVAMLLNSPRGQCYTLAAIAGWLRCAGFSAIAGPFPSSPLRCDPDSLLIAQA